MLCRTSSPVNLRNLKTDAVGGALSNIGMQAVDSRPDATHSSSDRLRNRNNVRPIHFSTPTPAANPERPVVHPVSRTPLIPGRFRIHLDSTNWLFQSFSPKTCVNRSFDADQNPSFLASCSKKRQTVVQKFGSSFPPGGFDASAHHICRDAVCRRPF